MEDAELVQKFIDSNEKLKSKMRNVNPFIYNKSGVGYALDGLLSYNSILSNIMSSYFEKLQLIIH